MLGAGAAAIYIAHAFDLLVHAHPPSVLLWSCDVAALLVAIGLLVPLPLANAAGGVLLVVGVPFWILEIAGGQPIYPTAPLLHLVLPVLSILGMRKLGLPCFTWLAAVFVLALATLAARVIAPPHENVNLAHAIPDGWDFVPSHGLYLVFVGASVAIASYLVERALRRL